MVQNHGRLWNNCQNLGFKSQDRVGAVALTSSLVLSANAWHGGVVGSATPAAPLLLGGL